MRKTRLAGFITALMLMLPIGALANHAVPIVNNAWQLIGVAGLFSLAGEGGSLATTLNPDFSSTTICSASVVIDIADPNNNMSWDGNITAGQYNTVPEAVNTHFADTASAVLANLAGTNTGLGLPHHSVVGVRALDIKGSRLAKAIVVVSRSVASATGTPQCVDKSLGSPMRTMYLTSTLSSGQPDLFITYQALYEGGTFKVSFKDSATSAWDISKDKIYTGVLDHTRTYDNALPTSALALLTPTTSGGGGGTAASGLRNVVCTTGTPGGNCAFDANITTDYINEPFNNRAGYEGNRTALDGNLTMYRYVKGVASGGGDFWEIQTFEGDGEGAEASTNSVINGANDNLLVGGYGYWVRLMPNTRSVDDTGGFLVNDEVKGSAAYYANTIKAGWNLLAFDDSKLRYSTTGFVAQATGDVYSPYSTVTANLASADADGCAAFNEDVTAANTGGVNTLDVVCLANASGAVLISDKQFYFTGAVASTTSLAGKVFTAADQIDIGGATPIMALPSRLGEYAVLLETNADFQTIFDGGALAVGVFNNNKTLEVNASDTPTIVTEFNTYMTSTGKATNALATGGLDFNSTSTTNTGLLLAADQRFFVRDNTFIRVFDTVDQNGSVLDIVYGGQSHKTTTGVNWLEGPDGSNDRDAAYAAIATANAADVVAKFVRPLAADTNGSIIFMSTKQLNFDVKEINVSARFLVDQYAGAQAETNSSVYGAFLKAYQASSLVEARSIGGAAGELYIPATLENLTYTAFWAEDFPNNGPIYYVAGNGYKPEMFITAETADANPTTAAAAGTITWKALDVTRDPKEWFDPANGFELFTAEKEKGYWVYAEQGYQNPVTVGTPSFTSTSAVIKHFDNEVDSNDESIVFNWFNGYITANVGGLVRPSYTSGQSYNVEATLGEGPIPLATTGAVSGSAQSQFTSYLSDFETGLRPTGVIEANVSAGDGLGGRNTNGALLTYVQPQTPTVTFSGKNIAVTSDTNAKKILLFDGAQPDNTHTPASVTDAGGNASASIDLSTLKTVKYPAKISPVDYNGTIPDQVDALGTLIKDLRVVASTGDADTLASGYSTGSSVYSNARLVRYLPIYSATGHLTASIAGDANATKPAFFNPDPSFDTNASDYGVGLAIVPNDPRVATLVFQPTSASLASGLITHADIFLTDTDQIGQLQYDPTVYQGSAFYLHVKNVDGSTAWYYGTFPGKEGTEEWGVSANSNGVNYMLVLQRVTTTQEL